MLESNLSLTAQIFKELGVTKIIAKIAAGADLEKDLQLPHTARTRARARKARRRRKDIIARVEIPPEIPQGEEED